MSDLIAQEQADGVSAILHVGGGEEARLPNIFGGQIAKRLHQSEGEQGDDGGDGFVGFDAENRIARTDDAGAQQGARDGEE